MDQPSNNNIEKCKKVMQKAPPLMPMFFMTDLLSGQIAYIPWMIILLLVFSSYNSPPLDSYFIPNDVFVNEFNDLLNSSFLSPDNLDSIDLIIDSLFLFKSITSSDLKH